MRGLENFFFALTCFLALVVLGLIIFAEYTKRTKHRYRSDKYYLTIVILSAVMMILTFFW